MWAYPSEAFSSAITGDHNVAVKVEIWQPKATAPVYTLTQVNDGPTTTTPSLVLTDGSVTMDKNSSQRFQCSVTFVSPDGTMIPETSGGNDWLTPWGNELRLYRGVYYADSKTAEYVPLGVFRISTVTIAEASGTPTITVTGYDRSRNIARNVPPYMWPDITNQQLTAGKPWANWIQVCCADRWPDVQFNDSAANWALLQNDPLNGSVHETYQSFSEGTDLWGQSMQYAQAAGCDLFFYRDGICYFHRDPNFNNMSSASTPPVASFVEGSTATFDKITRTLDDSNVYNQVVVYGESDILTTPLFTYPPNGTPAIDDDPSSPTYIGTQSPDGSGNYVYTNGSGYGVVTHIVTNNLLSTSEMIQDFAHLQLVLDIGMQQQVSIPSMVVNPCIDVDDIISITRPRIGVGIVEPGNKRAYNYVVSQIVIPLTATTAMTMQVREQRLLGQGNIAQVAGPKVRKNITYGTAAISGLRSTSTTGTAHIA